MASILICHIISALLFLIFIVLVISGLIIRSRKMIFSGIGAFMLMLGVLTYSTVVLARKALHAIDSIKNPLRGRTGEEIYTALLGKPEHKCIKVLHYLDQTIPVMDYAIALHFETCPQEFQRIILKHKFLVKREVSSAELIKPGVNINWLRTDALGDSIIVFTAHNPDATGQIIYCSFDSAKVMLLDYTN